MSWYGVSLSFFLFFINFSQCGCYGGLPHRAIRAYLENPLNGRVKLQSDPKAFIGLAIKDDKLLSARQIKKSEDSYRKWLLQN